jgi:hypothetical protein
MRFPTEEDINKIPYNDPKRDKYKEQIISITNNFPDILKTENVEYSFIEDSAIKQIEWKIKEIQKV